ncbi:MAG: hypothetical protein OXH59_10010 [Rhodospirillaceae bacterium]|nr:hypothetical protein [Rhodospirillaceae bacterium]
MILPPFGDLLGFGRPLDPQKGGPIQFPRRRSSLCGSRKCNAKPIPPPAAKRDRIAAGRQKLMDKAARSAARSQADREGAR